MSSEEVVVMKQNVIYLKVISRPSTKKRNKVVENVAGGRYLKTIKRRFEVEGCQINLFNQQAA